MHAAGILSEAGEKSITREDVKLFREAGADVILMPAPGTVPGITMEYIRGLVSCAHELGALTLTAIGTSQEGSDPGDCADVQDDGNGYASPGRRRIRRHGTA